MSISLKDKSIIICSIVRNAERGLKRNIPVIDAFCSKFNDYKIVVYENNSTDHTKELLKAWHLNDTERIHTIMEDTDAQATIPSSRAVTGNPFFCYKRIAKMTNLRNQYMDYVEKMGWKADYLMVVDLDVAQLYLKPLLSSFELNVSWDAVAAYGYSTSPRLRRRYHDSYALWENGEENTPKTEATIKEYADKYAELCKEGKPIPVYSAFGGVAIYKYEAIAGLRYQTLDNGDDAVEVKCEHFSIYKQMHDRGFKQIYINPLMYLKYQDLTWRIAWNSFKRIFLNK